MRLRGLQIIALTAFAAGCPDEGEPVDEPSFPEDYAASYTEVRNCRGSGDHDLHNIRILVDAAGLAAYQDRMEPFPEGSIVLKEEYEFSDADCEGDIVRWTVMTRLVEGTAPETLDWAWEDVDADRVVVSRDLDRCIGCHTGCGTEAMGGYLGTCAVP